MKLPTNRIQAWVLLAAIAYGAFATMHIQKLESRVSQLEQEMRRVPVVAASEARAATQELEQRLQQPRIFPVGRSASQ